MRHFRILLILLISAFAFTGCVFEDTSHCVSHNVTLDFTKLDEKGNDEFSKVIDKVDLFIFDDNGVFVRREVVNKEELDLYQGIQMFLDPGTYRIVFWANIQECTKVPVFSDQHEIDDRDNVFIKVPLVGDDLCENGDPSYYGLYRDKSSFILTVPATGIVEEEAFFFCSHIKMEVTVKGFYEAPSGAPAFTRAGVMEPIIFVNDLPFKYDFEMKTFGGVVDYMQHAGVQNEDAKEFKALFNTPKFGSNNTVEIMALTNSGTELLLESINLNDLIESENADIDLDTDEEIIIPIEIIFSGTDVEIKMADWIIKGTGPILP